MTPDHDEGIGAAMAEQAEAVAELLKAMANAQRLRVLCLLAEGERSVSEINAEVALSQSALSQHLAVLREQGLVKTRREAQSIRYSLVEGPAAQLIHALHDIYCRGRESAVGPQRARRARARGS